MKFTNVYSNYCRTREDWRGEFAGPKQSNFRAGRRRAYLHVFVRDPYCCSNAASKVCSLCSPTSPTPASDAHQFADNEQHTPSFEMSKKSGKVAKDLEEQTYEVREIVLAKIRGYPPWPAQVRTRCRLLVSLLAQLCSRDGHLDR